MIFQLAALILTFFMLNGCAGPAKEGSVKAVISKIQAQNKQSSLQENLLSQAGQATLQSYTDYKVGPEDLLNVTIFGTDELNREVRVNGQGVISLPLVGVVPVSGLSPMEIESRLYQLYKNGRFIRNPQISVQVKEYRHQRVMVSGAVVQPGSYEVIGPRTLLEMLGKAGGLSDKAGDMVHIIREQSAAALSKSAQGGTVGKNQRRETIIIDLNRLLVDNDLRLNFPIENGDVVYVPPAKSAFVLGAVKKPGQVMVKDNLTVTKALSMSEGLDPMLASDHVSVLRMNKQGKVVSIPVDLSQVMAGKEPDPVLHENDIVFVSDSGLKKFLYLFRNLLPGQVGIGAAYAL